MDLTPGEPSPSPDAPVKLQVPPFKMRLSSYQVGRPDVLVLFALSTAVGRYAGQTEHWYAELGVHGLRPMLEGDLEVDAVPLAAETEGTLEAWVRSLLPAFTCRRQVRSTDWNRGAVVVAAGNQARLYWMPHPDNALEILGLLLVTDKDGQLISTAWYRSTAPAEDGYAFRSESFSGRLTLVRDGDGNPSTDPEFIQKELDWHSIVMPLP